MPSYNYHSKRFNKSNVYELARAAYSTANFIKDAVNIEYKDFTEQIVNLSADFTSPGIVIPLVDNTIYTGITQGIQNGQRIGDSIKLQKLVLRGLIAKHSSAVVTGIRIILFKGKSEAGVPYTPADILEVPGNIWSSKNEANRYNTEFIYDEIKYLDSAQRNHLELEWNFPLNWHCNFEPAQATVADGGLYLYLGMIGSTNNPTMNAYYRVSYTDD